MGAALVDLVGLIVDGLRNNAVARRLVAYLGFALLFASGVLLIGADWIAATVGDELRRSVGEEIRKGGAALGLLGTSLVLLVVMSFGKARIGGGNDFRFEIESLRNERKKIQERIVEKPKADIIDTVQLNLNQLTEYYTINKSQARNSFGFSVFAVVVGLAAVIGGIWMFYVRNDPRIELATLTGIAGVVAQFIGAAYFYLYRKSTEQLNFFFGQLVKTQDTMLAVRLTEQISPKERQTRALERIVFALLDRSSPSPPSFETERFALGGRVSTKRKVNGKGSSPQNRPPQTEPTKPTESQHPQ